MQQKQQHITVWSAMYLILGILFIFSATLSASRTVWNGTTLLFIALAAFDIQIAFTQFFRRKPKKK